MDDIPFSLKGKSVLVTGASSGIGRATAVACSCMGARVVLSGRNSGALSETLHMMNGCASEDEGGHLLLQEDLSTDVALEDLVERCPVLDGFVSNAGVGGLLPVQSISRKEVDRISNLDLFVPMLLLRQFLRKKKLRRGSSVVFTSSAAGIYRVSPGNAVYAAASVLRAYALTA